MMSHERVWVNESQTNECQDWARLVEMAESEGEK